MKAIQLFLLTAFSLFYLSSCQRSDENLEVDLKKYNPDTTAASELDKWISSTFTDPYNIEVIYRFNRDLGNTQRDIAPVALDHVTPMMNAVLDVYLKPYERVAGKTFIRTYTPKQFVLFGSVSYNTNGSVTLGTADGGRRVVLYDVNNFNPANVTGLKQPMRTIHHEFTHILNQTIAIPEDFQLITKADYVTDWTNAAYSQAEAKSLGFVTRYSRSSFSEDFAEMTAHLLVEGQVWFNNYVSTTNNDAAQKLRKKEEIVVRYFKEYFDIDFAELQAEVQRTLKEVYGDQDPVDLTQSLAAYLNQNRVASIQYNPAAAHYTTYGNSVAMQTLFSDVQVVGKAQLARQLGWSNGVVSYLEFRFTDAQNMVFRIGFKASATDATTYVADYYFRIAIDPTTGVVTFTKSTVGNVHYTANAAFLTDAFERYILPYLTNRNFTAAWLPPSIPSTSNLYRTFGGFVVQGSTTNYIYGPIVLK